MAIISTKSQNFYPGSTVSATRDSDTAKASPDGAVLRSLSGATALPTSHPGFGSRNDGRFNVGDFLG